LSSPLSIGTSAVDIISFLFANAGTIVQVVLGLLSVASLVVALTPSPKDDEFVRKAIAFLSFLQPRDAAGTVKAPLTPPAPPVVNPPLLRERPSNVTTLRLDD
jgi:hypothetical protein